MLWASPTAYNIKKQDIFKRYQLNTDVTKFILLPSARILDFIKSNL